MGKNNKIGTASEAEENEVVETPALSTEPDEEPAAGGESGSDDPLEAAKKEAAGHYERLLRVSAELDNFKKRTAREMSELRKYAAESLFKDLLGVLDNLERAVVSAKSGTESDAGIVEGVELTIKELLKIFDKHQVRPIDPMGEPFDPTYHQALMRQESDEHPENTVVSVVQKGYTINDRLLRPAMVAVSAPKSAE